MTHLLRKPGRIGSFTAPILAGLIGVWIFSGQSRLMAGPSDPNPKTQPQAALTEFYRWYLESLAHHRDPLSDEPVKTGQYVSKKLIQQIHKLENSPDGLDEDYFTKSQDILEDWQAHIVVSEVQMKDKSASALVTLGVTKDSMHRLKLNLVLEGASWKISKVRESVAP